MYRYVSDVSNLSHYIIQNFCNKFDYAVDATLGNGYDTDFLSENFTKVYSFDIQNCTIEAYRNKNRPNVELINDSHEDLSKYIKVKVNCIMYNLGFLPGGDKGITTKSDTTLKSIKNALEIIDKGSIITIALYRGHIEGKIEEEVILNFVGNLPKNNYAVLLHSFLNRDKNAPILIVIEKK